MNNVGKLSKNNRMYSVIKGVAVSLFLSLVGIFIYAVVLAKTSIQESTIKVVLISITGVCILIGSSISSMGIKKNGIINGVCVGAIYLLSLYILSSIALCGFYLNISSIIMIAIGMILGGIGGIIGVNIGK